MRRLLPLVAGVLLLGAGEGAFAAHYQWSAFGRHFVSVSTSCADVVQPLVRWAQAVNDMAPAAGGVAASSGASMVTFWDGSCSGNPIAVGDSLVFGLCQDSSSFSCSDTTATLSAIYEDDSSSDISAIPFQRVLVLVGCALMAGLGWIMGAR